MLTPVENGDLVSSCRQSSDRLWPSETRYELSGDDSADCAVLRTAFVGWTGQLRSRIDKHRPCR